MTSSTCPGSSPARATASLHDQGAELGRGEPSARPRKRPVGTRTAERITASRIVRLLRSPARSAGPGSSAAATKAARSQIGDAVHRRRQRRAHRDRPVLRGRALARRRETWPSLNPIRDGPSSPRWRGAGTRSAPACGAGPSASRSKWRHADAKGLLPPPAPSVRRARSGPTATAQALRSRARGRLGPEDLRRRLCPPNRRPWGILLLHAEMSPVGGCDDAGGRHRSRSSARSAGPACAASRAPIARAAGSRRTAVGHRHDPAGQARRSRGRPRQVPEPARSARGRRGPA